MRSRVICLTVSFSYDGRDYEAETEYSPATPDVRYLKNGDPGYPGDSAECAVLKCKQDGAMLSDDEITDLYDVATWVDALYEAAGEAASEMCEPDPEERLL